jgi:hypothetical protein
MGVTRAGGSVHNFILLLSALGELHHFGSETGIMRHCLHYIVTLLANKMLVSYNSLNDNISKPFRPESVSCIFLH